tara:strand:- start:5186 stop:5551 length:366 start_codon:yes stop_codon:yes gene_type:complete
MPRKKVTKKETKKVKDLSQAHGKEENNTPSSLDQVWGDTGLSKYKTLDEGEYLGQLDEFNKTDLQAHATKVGLIPIDNTTELKKRLLKEFRKHTAKYSIPPNHVKSTTLDAEAMKILSEGK